MSEYSLNGIFLVQTLTVLTDKRQKYSIKNWRNIPIITLAVIDIIS